MKSAAIILGFILSPSQTVFASSIQLACGSQATIHVNDETTVTCTTATKEVCRIQQVPNGLGFNYIVYQGPRQIFGSTSASAAIEWVTRQEALGVCP